MLLYSCEQACAVAATVHSVGPYELKRCLSAPQRRAVSGEQTSPPEISHCSFGRFSGLHAASTLVGNNACVILFSRKTVSNGVPGVNWCRGAVYKVAPCDKHIKISATQTSNAMAANCNTRLEAFTSNKAACAIA